MDRAEATGLGVALAGHAALLGVLSLGFATASQPPIMSAPVEVSFVEDVALVSAAPEPTIEPPAQSIAPDYGAPEEAAPQPADMPMPSEPTPSPKAVQAPPEPKPAPRDAVKPAPSKSAKSSSKAPPEKAAPTKSAPSRNNNRSGKAEETKGSRLGADFLKGIGRDPTPSKSQKQTGAVMSAQAAADIGSAIRRQIQPCADRQVNPGPGANRIKTTINLRLNRDGSLAGRPRVVGQSGIDDGNRRYAERVADLAIATFMGCSPLKGLPAELYDVPKGWSNFTMIYSLPG